MALLPDGSLRAEAGNRAICLAARAHSVPGKCEIYFNDVFHTQ